MFFHKLWPELGLLDLLFIKYICEVGYQHPFISRELVVEKLATSSKLRGSIAAVELQQLLDLHGFGLHCGHLDNLGQRLV